VYEDSVKAPDRLRGSPKANLVVVVVAFFNDALLYGLVIPLTEQSPAQVRDEWALGVLYGGYALGLLGATPILARLSDRIGRRGPLLGGLLTQALATLLFAFAGNPTAMLLARMLQGGAAAATWTAGLALVAETFVQRRTQMMGLAMLGSNSGSVLGPALGGLLYDWSGSYRFPFLVAGVFLALDGCLRFLLLSRTPPQNTERPAKLADLFRDRAVLAAALIVVLGVGGWGLLEPLLPNHLQRTAGASPGAIGFLFTLAILFYGLCVPCVDRATARWGLRPVMTAGLTAMALSLPLLALSGSLFLVGAALCLVSVLYAFALNPCFTEFAEAVDRRGTGGYAAVYAVYNIAYAVGMVGSDVLAGAVAGQTSFQAALFITAGVMLAFVPVVSLVRAPQEPATAVPNQTGSQKLSTDAEQVPLMTPSPSADPATTRLGPDLDRSRHC
jgi:MFS transporter, DHA1 family, solute carrier family 18 (vesicular amine transporter), member 1/2